MPPTSKERRPPEGTLRPQKVAEARRKIENGDYDDPQLIGEIVDKVLADIKKRAKPVE